MNDRTATWKRDEIPLTYPALIERAGELFADTEAMSDGDVSLSFAELADRIEQCAGALVASGIEPGDTVGVWAPNAWEWVVAGLSILRCGAVMVPVNTRFKGREAAYVLGKARVKLLFTVVGFLGNDYVTDLEESGETVPTLREIVVLRGDREVLLGQAVNILDVAQQAGARGIALATKPNPREG